MSLWFYELSWILARPVYHLASFVTILKASWRCGVRHAEERVIDEVDFLATDLGEDDES